ncbi:MAG: hypothetical protein K8T20_02255 [Planctomycetes bacterium]|nr:hypothetical protein [Planctomycetota bacterium]
MRPLLFIFALCLPAIAGPDIDALARRLGDEDPGVREAARKELLALDEDDAPALLAAAAKTADPEARAALREIAEIIADRRYIDCAKEWADAASSRRLELDDVRKWEVHPVSVFLCWVGEPERIRTEIEGGGDTRMTGFEKGWTENLQKAGYRWLRAWTLADLGEDPAAWRAFATRTRRLTWTAMRLEGLSSRGFRVLDPDPAVAAAELVAAWRPLQGGKRRNTVAHGRSLSAETFLLLLRSIFGRNDGVPFPAPDVDAVLDWVEASRYRFTREKNRLTSLAVADDFLASLDSDRPGVQVAALEALKRWPDQIPEKGWELLPLDAERVAAAMDVAKRPIPREKLAGFLEALPPWTKPSKFSAIWVPGDLADLITTRSNQAARSLALDLLAGIDAAGARKAAATALSTYVAEPQKGEHSLARSAALEVARGKNAARLDLVERWLTVAPDKVERIDVAIALARRGRRVGFDLVVDRASRDLLDLRRGERFRKFVAGAPSHLHADRWSAWAAEAKDGYAWNASTKKWEKPK